MMKNRNMRNILLLSLSIVLSFEEVFGQSENEIKKEIYPFMAIVYYPDATIVEFSGARFSRSAVLFRSDWLISSSLETNGTKMAFPQKTLLARAGAVTIDSNFTFNEDEGEQEREIIQVVRPSNFNVTQWWNSDITLLKTLLPFVMNSTVSLATLSVKHDYMDKTCYILVFAKKYGNSTDDKLLMQLTVELLSASKENCGAHFRNDTMICATSSDDNKNIVYEPNFCYGNGGGPLMCDGNVIGVQTYIGYNCKHPYLYQLLSAWDDFITCGVEENCRTQQCGNICASIDKDEEIITYENNEIITMPTSETTKDIIMDQSIEESNDEERLILTETRTTILKAIVDNHNETPTPTIATPADITTAKETTQSEITENDEKTTRFSEDLETSWPKEKLVGYRKKLDDVDNSENVDRTANVEAQRHEVKKKGRSAAESINVFDKMGLIYSLSFELLFFICIV